MKKAAAERVRRAAGPALLPALLAAGLALGRCAPAYDPDKLLADLDSPDLEVRQDTLEAIDRIVRGGNYQVFQRGAESPDKGRRIQAILYLARMDQPEARAALRNLLKVEKRGLLPYNPIRLKPQSEETDSRILVANLIAQQGGDPEAVATLMQGIDDRQSPEVLVGTCLALGALSDPKAIPHLASLSRHQDVGVIRAAVEALGRYPSRETLEILKTLATHPVLEVRSEVLSALALHEGPETLEVVRSIAASDPSPAIRVSAVRQLGRFRDPSLVPFLVERLRDADTATREGALEVLGQITGQSLGPRPESWSRWWAQNEKRLAVKR
jgi:HEAT repeat protein